jgi:hypothetical protein
VVFFGRKPRKAMWLPRISCALHSPRAIMCGFLHGKPHAVRWHHQAPRNPGSVYTNCETAGATFIVAAVIVPGMTGIVGYSAVTESVRVGGDSPGAGGFCPTLDSSLGDFGSNQPRNNGSTPELLFYSSSRFSSSIPIGMRGTLALLFSNRRKKWAKRPIFGRVLWH